MIDVRVMALCELSQDLLFHKIPADRLGYYLDESLSAGERAAREFSGRDINELYRQYGIEIEYKEKSASALNIMLRGQAIMGKGEYKVVVYTDSIRALTNNSGYEEIPAMDYEQALKIHLAHEFFHFWEYKIGSSIVESLESVVTLKLFGFSRKAKINRCGEVAAHSFTRTLLGLPFLPNLYDYLYLIGIGKMSKEAFDSKIARLSRYV